MRFDAQKVMEAAGEINRLCGMLQRHLTRSYPQASVRGSQHREDEVFDELLPGPGVYVDIGAADPVQCSNTWLLYSRGWRGLLVEPLYWYWPHLLRVRRGDFLVESAVRNYTGRTLLRVQGSISSVLPSWNIQEQGELIVDCQRGQEILDQFPQIRDTCRFCNIDVEGVEGEVLESIDWAKFRPEVVCVEYRIYDPEKIGEDASPAWEPILLGAGYHLHHQTPMNKIYVLAPTT